MRRQASAGRPHRRAQRSRAGGGTGCRAGCVGQGATVADRAGVGGGSPESAVGRVSAPVVVEACGTLRG